MKQHVGSLKLVLGGLAVGWGLAVGFGWRPGGDALRWLLPIGLLAVGISTVRALRR